jgi:CRISPR-associated endonuclease/helicase Cas3
VAEAINELARGNKKAGREKIDIEPPQLLVGGRRVREREQLAEKLADLGFIGGTAPATKPTFLVATAAGEAGVDIDADHMVCDLVPWERMVQRLGRVNRRGNGDATIVLFDTAALEKKDENKARLAKTRDLLEQAADLSPGALVSLKNRLAADAIAEASTPEPLYPALTRPLADAWAMTSLDAHTGRPEVEPWLRGWEEEKPQTTLIWRTHLPVRRDKRGRPAPLPEGEIRGFFDAAPPHVSEGLETDTFRVVDWLVKRALAVLTGAPAAIERGDDDEPPAAPSDEVGIDEAEGHAAARPLLPDDVALFVLSSAGEYLSPAYTIGDLGDLALEGRRRARDDLERRLAGSLVVVNARLAGLSESGLLDDAEGGLPPTADADRQWSDDAGFRVRPRAAGPYEPEGGWRFEAQFVVAIDDEGDPLQLLTVEHLRAEAQSAEGHSTAEQPQELEAHQRLAARKARDIGARLGLPATAISALGVAARLHDEGKRASTWQRAFRAPHERDDRGEWKVFAKTRGPINQAVLNGYRHEFGSLPALERDGAFLALPEDWRELVRHIVAAHHGHARPVISISGCEGTDPELTVRARDVALRFARLQKRWGPWGLAWWEALLRAADQQASRDNREAAAPVAALEEAVDG